MQPTDRTLVATTLLAPAGLFAYGLLRFVDGLDGEHGPGWAWTVGHLCFLVAMVSLAGFAITTAMQLRRTVATACAAAVTVAVVAFGWVILGDLSDSIAEALPVPDLVMAAGPLLLVAGLVPLLALSGRALMGRRWWVPPLFGLLGFVLVSADLDLLVVSAAAFAVALAAVGRLSARRQRADGEARAAAPASGSGRRAPR